MAAKRTNVLHSHPEEFSATSPFGEQDENGIDLSLLRENLRLTPTERWVRHQRALTLVREVQRAGREYRLRRTPHPTA